MPEPPTKSPSLIGTMSSLFDTSKGVVRDVSNFSEAGVGAESPGRAPVKTESFYERVAKSAGGTAGVEECVQTMGKLARRLHKLSADPSQHAAFRRKGGITALAGLLRLGGATSSESAGAIMHLTYHAGNGEAIREAGAIPPLIELLREGPSSAAATRAAGALSNLAHANAANAAAIRDAGGVEALVALLGGGAESAGAASAAGALRNLAHGSAASRGAIRAAGACVRSACVP